MFSNTTQQLSSATTWLKYVRSEGHGFIFALKNKHPSSVVFDTNDLALEEIGNLIVEGYDVFISVANFRPDAARRISENVTEVSSLFIDLDCGQDKPYDNQESALRALAEVLEVNNFLPPSLVVDSGGGIHAYWCFDNPVPKDEWLVLAAKFKAYWLSVGLKIDPVVTADCARVMRVPDSYNHKIEGYPRLVKIIYPKADKTIRKYTVDEIKGVLPEEVTPDKFDLADKLSHLPPLKQILSKNDSSANLIASLCHQIKHVINSGGADRTEPEWHADLGLLKYTTEAPQILHDASNKHPDYSASDTDDKASRWTASPTTCEHYYNKLASPLCEGCIYKGKIKSPIQLGYPTPRGLQTVLNNVNATTSIIAPPAYLNAPNEIVEVSKKFAWDIQAMNLYNISTGRYVQKERFNTHFANRFVNLGTSQKPRLVSLGVAWIQHPQRREANGVRMAPNEPEDLPDGAINSWLGFSANPAKGDIKPFIKLFKRQIPNRDDRKYVLHWMANLFQNPASKAFTSIVMWSRIQGTGKNLIWECIGSLFNERHYTLVSQEVFDDAFTEWKANRVFVICDEVSSTEKRTTADRIKGWITSSSNSINTKNEPKFTQPNLIKYVFLSNHPDAVFLDDTDRRFFVVEVAQGRLPEKDAVEFTSWRDNGGREALLEFLLTLDIGDFNAKASAPMSSAKQEMIEDNKSDVERWLDQTLVNIHASVGREICSAEEITRNYHLASGNRCSSKAIAIALSKRGIKKISKQAKLSNGKRIRVYALENHPLYEAKTDKELGDIMDSKPFWG